MRFAPLVTAGLLATSAVALPSQGLSCRSTIKTTTSKFITTLKKFVDQNVPEIKYFKDAKKHGKTWNMKDNFKPSGKPSKTHHHEPQWSHGVDNQKYIDWNTFKANGVNLGGWLVQEWSSDQTWWYEQVPESSDVPRDEWNLCMYLGDKCGPVLEERYASYYSTADIDKLASVGVNLLRIPTNYQAWIDVPWSALYHGNQLKYLKKIADYAIKKYNMHVIIDLHSLPGGTNGWDHGEAIGHYGWWQNKTNLELSLQVVQESLNFIQDSGHPNAYTLAIINEACDNGTAFGTGYTVTAEGTNWMITYLNAVLKLVKKTNSKIPIMLQDSFMGEAYWSPLIEAGANVVYKTLSSFHDAVLTQLFKVIDTHIYFFSLSDTYSKYVTYSICGSNGYYAGDGKFPVFIGEFSDEIEYNNTLADRKINFDTQRYAFAYYTSGSAFWSARQLGIQEVSGEGHRTDYWSYLGLIDAGVITNATTDSYC